GEDVEIGEVKRGVDKELALKRSFVEPRHEPAPKEQERVDRKAIIMSSTSSAIRPRTCSSRSGGRAEEKPRGLGVGAAGRTSVTCSSELTADYRRRWFDVPANTW